MVDTEIDIISKLDHCTEVERFPLANPIGNSYRYMSCLISFVQAIPNCYEGAKERKIQNETMPPTRFEQTPDAANER